MTSIDKRGCTHDGTYECGYCFRRRVDLKLAPLDDISERLSKASAITQEIIDSCDKLKARLPN